MVLAGVAGHRGRAVGELLREPDPAPVQRLLARGEQGERAVATGALAQRDADVAGDVQGLPGPGRVGGAAGDPGAVGAGGGADRDAVGVGGQVRGEQQLLARLRGDGGHPAQPPVGDGVDHAQRGQVGHAQPGEVFEGLLVVEVLGERVAGLQKEGEVLACGLLLGLGDASGLLGAVAFDGEGGDPGEGGAQREVGVARGARGAVVHRERAEQLPVGGQDRGGPAGGQARPGGEVAVALPGRVGEDVGDDDGFAAVGGGAARAHALAGGDAVDGLVVEVGEAGRGAVPQVEAVGVGEQHGRDDAGHQLLDEPGHAVEDLAERGAAGDLLQQGALLRGEGTGELERGDVDPEDADAHDAAGAVLAGFDGEVEVHLVAVALVAVLEADRDVLAGVRAAGAVDVVEQGGQALSGEFGHAAAQREADGPGAGAENGVEGGVGGPQDVFGAVQQGEHGRRAAEQIGRLVAVPLARTLPGRGSARGYGRLAASGHRPRLSSRSYAHRLPLSHIPMMRGNDRYDPRPSSGTSCREELRGGRCVNQGHRRRPAVTVGAMKVTHPSSTATARATSSPVAAA